MNFVSYPATAMPSRWRSDVEVGAALGGGWMPAQRQSWAPARHTNVAGRLAQAPTGTLLTPWRGMLSAGATVGALMAGGLLIGVAKKGELVLLVPGVIAAAFGLINGMALAFPTQIPKN